ncbi:NYN domain-containing protein [Nocardioides donggukensis]|uniref:NYN domain-containing protein n=1 Tax=Nocardioides donggukensis TaxID=2774019 RepID=A0A927Q1Y7_9ACTN|nr:NYN domain-containing protein [Nocardioides donggukensis]MBD8869864.1 NYN domain-containing protein [Nocardioides donggukensis]
MSSKPRIALLIDADNSPAVKIDLILNELSGFGEPNIRRAYGNWKKAGLKGWEQVLHAKAIRPVQQFDYSRGKNASDMALVVDAMALLYTDEPDAFAIVSSDADFTPLVMHLRDRGASVYGFGERKTPEPFVGACSRFLYLDQLGVSDEEDDADDEPEVSTSARPSARETPHRTPTAELKQDAALVDLLRNAVKSAADESGWARIGAVGNHIGNQSSFDPRNYGYASMSKLLKATQLFEIAHEGTNDVSVRDKRKKSRG